MTLVDDMIRTWAPDDFWQAAQPLIPVTALRPQGGGKRPADDWAVLAAIVYLVQAGCSWAKLPAAMFGVGRSTVHRRVGQWRVVTVALVGVADRVLNDRARCRRTRVRRRAHFQCAPTERGGTNDQ